MMNGATRAAAGLAMALETLALARPTRAESAALCTDRPTKANASCTVPAGAFQIESDVLNRAQTDGSATTTTVIQYVNPTLKYGLTDHSDLQVNWAPRIRARSALVGSRAERQRGGGDVTLRYKHRVTAVDNRIGVALLPALKIPTAPSGLGNERWEGGLAVPINIPLPDGYTLTLGPEFDVLAEADGSGIRYGLVNLVNLSRSIGRATLLAEFWSLTDLAAEQRADQRSADFAVVLLLAPRLQVDAGLNIGLTEVTPDLQFYFGVSYRH